MRITKKGKELLSDERKLTATQAEMLLKFANMTDEQFAYWATLETREEVQAFLKTIPLPKMSGDSLFITLRKGKNE